jgi:predicted site-specific integrase-resolvase
MHSLHLTPPEVAERWNITTKTLSQWRYNGRGPYYSKVSRLITYLLEDVEQFENIKRCRSTSEYPLKSLEEASASKKKFSNQVTPLLKKES